VYKKTNLLSQSKVDSIGTVSESKDPKAYILPDILRIFQERSSGDNTRNKLNIFHWTQTISLCGLNQGVYTSTRLGTFGATASAIVYTMVEMVKANGLNIYKYLNYLLDHRPSAGMTDKQLDQLAPWSKNVIDSCANIK